MVERRNYDRRGEAIRRVVEHLRKHGDPLGDIPFEAPDVPGPAVERILKRLAVRGLVRRAGSGWVAADALVRAAPLQKCEPAA